jgi:hypothetical protein
MFDGAVGRLPEVDLPALERGLLIGEHDAVLMHMIGRHVIGNRAAAGIIDRMQIAAAAILLLQRVRGCYDSFVVLKHGPVSNRNEQTIAVIGYGHGVRSPVVTGSWGQPVAPGPSGGESIPDDPDQAATIRLHVHRFIAAEFRQGELPRVPQRLRQLKYNRRIHAGESAGVHLEQNVPGCRAQTQRSQ